MVLRLVDDAHRRPAPARGPGAARRLVRAGRPGAARGGPPAAPARGRRGAARRARPRPRRRRRGDRRPDDPRRRPRRARRASSPPAGSACRRCSSPTASACSGRSSSTRRTGDEALALWELVQGWLRFPPALRDPAAEGSAPTRTLIAETFRPYLTARDWQTDPEPDALNGSRPCPPPCPRNPSSPRCTTSGPASTTLLAGLDDADWAATDLPARAGTSRPSSPTSSAPSRCCSATAAPAVEIDARRRTRTCATTSAASTRRGSMALAAEPPADVLARFRDHVARRKEALDAMTEEEWDTVGFTPAGQDTYGRFMRIRVFDQLAARAGHPRRRRPAGRRGGPGRRGRRSTRWRRRWASSSARRPGRRRGRGCASSSPVRRRATIDVEVGRAGRRRRRAVGAADVDA